jgi:DnaJ-class molecular chaperone
MGEERKSGKRTGACALNWCAGISLMHALRCKKCKGERTVKEKARQEIFIEKGMQGGQRIVLSGAGDQEVRTRSSK